MNEQLILDKLNVMHVDIILMKNNLKTTQEDVEDHELILRGASKVNGLVSEVKALKVSQSTAHRLWISMTSLAATIIAYIGLSK
jgi:predicted phage tail protein